MSTLMTAAEPAREAMLDVARSRRDFPVLQRQVHGTPLVYLDNAATELFEATRAKVARLINAAEPRRSCRAATSTWTRSSGCAPAG